MDLEQIKEKWASYSRELINRFADSLPKKGKNKESCLGKLDFFAINYLLEFESEVEEDPENEDGGIITLDTVTAGYIDGFLGRWLIQKTDMATEKDIKEYQKVFNLFYDYLKVNKLYKEKAAQFTKLKQRLTNKKKYIKRIKSYLEIQELKGQDEEEYLEQMREWDFEDLY